MTLFSIFFVLLIEQFRPLRADNPIYGWIVVLAARVEHSFNAGRAEHGRLAWLVMMLALVLPTLLIYWLCVLACPIAQLAWTIVIVYLTLGFRHYSHYFTAIQLALDNSDLTEARRLLAEWTRQDVLELDAQEISRLAVENALITTHRHVFGVFFWYAVLSVVGLGPVGAVVYRLAEYVQRRWQREQGADGGVSSLLAEVAQRAWVGLDWLPARATALGFAIVGSFEDAMDGWRNHAQKFPQDNDGVILAATAGAINVRLGGAGLNTADEEDAGMAAQTSGASTPGQPAQQGHLASVVGLVWRSVIMWLVLVALLTMANLMG